MMYRLIRWLLNKFNYDLVSFAEMEFLNNAVNERAAIAMGKFELEFIVSSDGMSSDVVTKGGSPVWINIRNSTLKTTAVKSMPVPVPKNCVTN